MPQSNDELLLAGLNLLRLLVQNHIAEFHTELELLPQEVLRPLCCRSLSRVPHAVSIPHHTLNTNEPADSNSSEGGNAQVLLEIGKDPIISCRI